MAGTGYIASALDKRQIIALAFQSLLSILKEASVNYEIHVVEDGIPDELRQILAAEASAIHATQGSGVVPSLAKSFDIGRFLCRRRLGLFL